MRETTLLVKTCATCPHIYHKNVPGDIIGYYCHYSNKMIPLKIDILNNIWEECKLKEV